MGVLTLIMWVLRLLFSGFALFPAQVVQGQSFAMTQNAAVTWIYRNVIEIISGREAQCVTFRSHGFLFTLLAKLYKSFSRDQGRIEDIKSGPIHFTGRLVMFTCGVICNKEGCLVRTAYCPLRHFKSCILLLKGWFIQKCDRWQRNITCKFRK